MNCTCHKPSLHDRVLRAISMHLAEEHDDIVTAAARLLVSARETDVAEGFERVDAEEVEEYELLVADIDNEICRIDTTGDEKPEIACLRSAIVTARSMGKESTAEDLEGLLAMMENDSPENVEG